MPGHCNAVAKGFLFIFITLLVGCSGDFSIFGMFEHEVNLKIFEEAAIELNMTENSFKFRINSSHAFSNMISKAEELRWNISRNNSSKNLVFTDLSGTRNEIIKESLIGKESRITLNKGQSILYDNGLSGDHQESYHQHLAESMLSFVNGLHLPSNDISIIVDETEDGRNLLTSLVEGKKKAKKNIVSITILEKSLSRENFISSTNIGNDLFLVDCDGQMAAEMIKAAEEIGLAGLKNANKWILSKRTVTTLPLSCSLPEGKYYGIFPRGMELNVSYIVNKVQSCKQKYAKTCLKSMYQSTVYQLWTNHKEASGSSWVEISRKKQDMESLLLEKQDLNPYLPRLRVSVAETAPWLMLSDFDESHDHDFPCGRGGRMGLKNTSMKHVVVCMHGFAIDVLKSLETRLKFVGIPKISNDLNYGTFHEDTGIADGIVGELSRGEADLGIDLIEDKTRNRVIKFSKPYGITSLAIAHLQKYNYKEADVFQPFSLMLWLAVLGTIALLVILVWTWERISPYSQYQLNKRTIEHSRTFELEDSATYIMGTFFTGEIIDQKPKAFGSHLAIILFSFVSILIISAYSANLITFLVVLDDTPLVTGLTDEKLIGESSKLTIGIHGSTVVSGYLESHSDARVRKLANTRVKAFKFFKDVIKALKNKEVDMILYDYLSVTYTQSVDRDCSIKVQRLPNAELGIALSFNNKSTWERRLNLAAVDIVNSGEADTIVKKWFDQQTCARSNIFYSLDIKRMGSLFAWLSIGILACIITMVVAISIAKLKRFCSKVRQKEPENRNPPQEINR